jgi:hypothetical protein
VVAGQVWGCTWALSNGSYTGYGIAHLDYDAHRANIHNYIIEHSYAKAYGFADCGPHGYGVTPYQTTVQLKFQFNGTSLSCTGGVDAGFPRNVGVSYSCTGSGSTVRETMSSTCYWQSSCSVGTGYMSIIVPSGATFYYYVLAQTKVTVVNTAGDSYWWTTDWNLALDIHGPGLVTVS